jgi:hypothetical protein
MPFTDTYSEATPNNSTVANQIDDEIVKTEREYRERLAVEHCFYEDETGHTDVGEHKQGSARIGRGDAASRPVNNSNNPGSVYVTEEAGTPTKIEYDNGTDWVDITDLSGALVALLDYLKKDGSVALTGAWNAGQEITATRFNGPVTGDVTGNISGDASTLGNSSPSTSADNNSIAKRTALGDLTATTVLPTHGVGISYFNFFNLTHTQNTVYDALTSVVTATVGVKQKASGYYSSSKHLIVMVERSSANTIKIYYLEGAGSANLSSASFVDGNASAVDYIYIFI